MRIKNHKNNIFWQQRRAASLLSYGLLVGLISVIALAAINGIGVNVSALFGRTDNIMTDAAEGTLGQPTAFNFTASSNTATNTLILSNIILIEGLEEDAEISISGDGSPRLTIDGGSNWVTSALVANGTNIQLQLTSAATGSTTHTALIALSGYVTNWQVTTTGDPGDIVVALDNGIVKRIAEDETLIWTHDFSSASGVRGVSAAPSGDTYAVIQWDPSGRLRRLNGVDGTLVWEYDNNVAGFGTGELFTVASHPSGDAIIGGGETGYEGVQRIHRDTGVAVWRNNTGYTRKVQYIVIDAAGDIYASSVQGRVQKHDGDTGAVLWTWDLSGGVTWNIGLTASDTELHVSSFGPSAKVYKIDTSTGLELTPVGWPVTFAAGNIYGLFMMPDGSTITGRGFGSMDTSRIDASGSITWTLGGFNQRDAFAWDPIGERLYACDTGGIRIINEDTGAFIDSNFGSAGGRCNQIYID